jgi:hypothetical protein
MTRLAIIVAGLRDFKASNQSITVTPASTSFTSDSENPNIPVESVVKEVTTDPLF